LTKKTSISRGKLVKSARDLFRHQGYNKTTIDDISAASGLNRGSIYFYFKGKEDLARAALDHALERGIHHARIHDEPGKRSPEKNCMA
jgi:TetR/AcrR family transcriptional repressor of nem operon